MSIRITAVSLNPDLGSKEKALEWSRSMSPKAQYIEAAEGRVSVSTYKVAIKYMSLNFCGFHIACMISLHDQNKKSCTIKNSDEIYIYIYETTKIFQCHNVLL